MQSENTTPIMSKSDIMATITVGIMMEYDKYIEDYGNQSIHSDEMEALSREVSNQMDCSNFSVRSQDMPNMPEFSDIEGDGQIQNVFLSSKPLDYLLGLPEPPKVDPIIFKKEQKLLEWARNEARQVIKELQLEDEDEINNKSFEIE